MQISDDKLKRAIREIAGLDSYIKSELGRAERKATLLADYDEENDEHRLIIGSVPDIDDLVSEVSIWIGIVVHLIRSSLDNLVFDLAEMATGGNIDHPRALQFPISDTEEQFDGQRYRIAELSVPHQQIIEAHQPYHPNPYPDNYSGDYIHPLAHLRDLSNEDKHQTVVEVTYSPNSFQIQHGVGAQIHGAWTACTMANPQQYFANFQPMDFRVGEVYIKAQLPERLPIEPGMVVGLATPSIGLAEHRHAVSTLRRFHTYVSEHLLPAFNA